MNYLKHLINILFDSLALVMMKKKKVALIFLIDILSNVIFIMKIRIHFIYFIIYYDELN